MDTEVKLPFVLRRSQVQTKEEQWSSHLCFWTIYHSLDFLSTVLSVTVLSTAERIKNPCWNLNF